MPDKSEKERRKQIMDDLKHKADQEFERSLPMSRDNFKKIFDHLDTQLDDKSCDDTYSLTKAFLLKLKIEKVDEVLEWLADHGGYCDCEILANVEEQLN
jgi:F0F1-type ATP synthase membrane subunit b/b'